jgi:hypothetical protein
MCVNPYPARSVRRKQRESAVKAARKCAGIKEKEFFDMMDKTKK